MDNRRRNRKGNRPKNEGFFSKLFVSTGGNPEDIEDQDWYLDTPDVRLTRIFSVVLCLHIVAVGGILAFKMIDKAAEPATMALSKKATVAPRNEAPQQKEYAGKVASAAPAVAVPSVADTGSRTDRYCVIPGDTLSGIAAKLGVSTEQLKMTNHIHSPDEILPGMWLKKPIPVVLDPADRYDYDTLPDHPVAVATPQQKVEKTAKPYQVQKGDTAWRISQKFGVPHGEILKYNGIDRPEMLQAGQVIMIPQK